MNKYTQVQPRIHKSQLAEWIVVHFICFVISQVCNSYKFIMKSDTKGTAVYSSDALSVNW